MLTDEQLKKYGFFKPLTDERAAAIAALSSVRDLPADTEVLREGQQADNLYLVLEGRLSLAMYVPGRAAEKSIVSTISRGELLGWSALLPGRMWQATARTLKPTRLLAIDGTKLRELCDRDHEIGYAVMKHVLTVVGQRLTESRLQLLDMFAHPDG